MNNFFDDLLTKLMALKKIQDKMDWAECLPEDIWLEHFDGKFKELKRGLNVDTRRHYETSTTVIEIHDRILGIRHITNLFSESSDVEDAYFTISFFEMKEIKVTSYEKI